MTTAAFIALAFTGLVAGDIWLYKSGRLTYSEVIRGWGQAWPPARLLLAFGMGMLLGHFYW